MATTKTSACSGHTCSPVLAHWPLGKFVDRVCEAAKDPATLAALNAELAAENPKDPTVVRVTKTGRIFINDSEVLE